MVAVLLCSCTRDTCDVTQELSTKASQAERYMPLSRINPELRVYTRFETDDMLYLSLKDESEDILERIISASVVPIRSYPIVNVYDQMFQYAKCKWYTDGYMQNSGRYQYPEYLFYLYFFPGGGYAIVNADPRREAFLLSYSLTGVFEPVYFDVIANEVSLYPTESMGIWMLGERMAAKASEHGSDGIIDLDKLNEMTQELWRKTFAPDLLKLKTMNIMCFYAMKHMDGTLSSTGGGGGCSWKCDTVIINPLICWSTDILKRKRDYYTTTVDCKYGFDNSLSMAKMTAYSMSPIYNREVMDILQSNPQDDYGQSIVESFTDQFIMCGASAAQCVQSMRDRGIPLKEVDPETCKISAQYTDSSNYDGSRRGIPLLLQMGNTSLYPIVANKYIQHETCAKEHILFLDMHRELDWDDAFNDEFKKRVCLVQYNYKVLFPDGDVQNKVYMLEKNNL